MVTYITVAVIEGGDVESDYGAVMCIGNLVVVVVARSPVRFSFLEQ